MMERDGRVMIVEDQSIVAMDLAGFVGGLGYQVLGPFQSGEQAIDSARNERPEVALMDISLPGALDGISTAEVLKERFGSSVIFLTGHSDTATMERAKLLDPAGYIVKPFDEGTLKATLALGVHRRMLQAGASLPSGWSSLERQGSLLAAIEQRTGEREDPKKILSQLPLFSDLPAELLEILAQAASVKFVSKGQVIAHEGDRVSMGFVPLTGRISFVKSSPGGRELIVELLSAGDLLGVVDALHETNHRLIIRAQCDSRLLCLPPLTLRDVIDRHPKLYPELLKATKRRLESSYNRERLLAHDDVAVRIASAIVELLSVFGRGRAEEGRPSFVHITRQELSDLVGTSAETAVRRTKDMEREGILDLSRPGIIKVLDLPSLKDLSLAGRSGRAEEAEE